VYIDPNRVSQGKQAGAGVCLTLAITALGFLAIRSWRTGLAFGILVLLGFILTLAALYWQILIFTGQVSIPLLAILIGVAVYLAVRLLRRSRPGPVEWLTFASVVTLLAVGGWLMADSVYSPPKYRPPYFRPGLAPTSANENPSPP
jgi:hypothetical protein